MNVVAFVDCKKHILYRVIKSRGAEHESTAFKISHAYKFLTDNWAWFLDRGFYLIGDSAYAIRSFLVTPYDNVHHSTPEDDYKFFHSGSRICVECAFGEVDLRFGILWRRLQFSLANNVRVVDACLCLHSFIIDFREGKAMSEIERDVFDEYFRRFLAAESGVGRMGVVGGEEYRQVGGRPRNSEQVSAQLGCELHDKLRENVVAQDRHRPWANWYRTHVRVLEE